MEQQSTRVLVTGGQGQLGRALHQQYTGAGATVLAPGRDHLNVTDAASINAAITQFAPTLLIHAAAATDVDRCEREPDWATLLNTTGTALIAAAAARAKLPLVYVSTNYIFDGARPAGEAYAEDDPPNPLSVYGRTKLAGEELVRQQVPAHFIVRTAQVYAATGRKFVQTMLGLAAAGKTTIGGVADQWVQPTYATDLAAGIAALAATQTPGTYHLTNSGSCSWAEWAQEIFRLRNLPVAVEPIPAATFKRDATPPANGVMQNNCAAALGITLPDWHEGLQRCLAEMAITP